MINEEKLTEKLKYLVIMLSKEEFQILDFNIMFDYITEDNQKKIESYYVDVRFDYDGPIDSYGYNFTNDIRKMMSLMRSYLSEYTITPEGKITTDQQIRISDGDIYRAEFVFETTHIFDTSFSFSF